MISFVYFDVGGVVIRDFSKTNKWSIMKYDLGVPEEINKDFDRLFDYYELNELCLSRDVETLIPIFENKFNIHFPKNYSWLNDFANRFEKNYFIWPVIKKINKNCRIGLLTNMYLGMFKAIQNRSLLPPFNWDVLVDSSVERLQKPDPKIYELAEKKSKSKHKEILFIDNGKKNIDAAKKFGWKTFLYDPSDHKESCQNLLTYFTSL